MTHRDALTRPLCLFLPSSLLNHLIFRVIFYTSAKVACGQPTGAYGVATVKQMKALVIL